MHVYVYLVKNERENQIQITKLDIKEIDGKILGQIPKTFYLRNIWICPVAKINLENMIICNIVVLQRQKVTFRVQWQLTLPYS